MSLAVRRADHPHLAQRVGPGATEARSSGLCRLIIGRPNGGGEREPPQEAEAPDPRTRRKAFAAAARGVEEPRLPRHWLGAAVDAAGGRLGQLISATGGGEWEASDPCRILCERFVTFFKNLLTGGG